jgi:hypothetical protein
MNDSIIAQRTWSIVAALCLFGAALLTLGSGALTGDKVPYVATVGAFAIIIAGAVVMWKSEQASG